MEKRRFVLTCVYDAILILFSAFGVISTLTHFQFMVDLGRLTNAPFLVTFTGLSNLSICLVASLCLAFRLYRKDVVLPSWLLVTRLVFVSLITITFLITACYLAPSVGADWWRLYINGSLFNHLLTPLWAIVGFLIFEMRTNLRYRICFYSLIPMGIYGLFYLIRAYSHVGPDGKIDGYYDIYGLARWGLGVTLALFVGFMVLALLLSSLLYFVNNHKK